MAFRVDKRDIDFILKEQLDLGKLLSFDAFKDFSLDDFDMTITEGIRLATEKVAPTNKEADQIGAQFDKATAKVTAPQCHVDLYKEYCENGWNSIACNPEFGGQGFPGSVAIAVGEAMVSASVTFMMTPGLTRGAGHVIEHFGTDEQKAKYVERMYAGEWAGTMCLTEPGAGSAVGDLKCSAKDTGDGKFLISGVKSFITSGDHNFTDQIIHLVLARVEGDPIGMKGVSLFIVPKFRINADGSLGEHNDVVCGGIEHKMGIHGSPTCTLNFGENGKCEGELIGQRGKGIVAMFLLMNEARIGVGIQGMSQAAAAYPEALDYAKERIQGVDILDMKDVNAPRVPIVKHPDVRRMLMTMKANTEGSRALLYKTAYYADIAMHSPDEKEREKYHDLVELMTPMCKAYCTDAAVRSTGEAVMILGGYGYCAEYPIEQYYRDTKIACIYEGTNGIQALDLLGRKVGLKGGMVFLTYMMSLNKFIDANKDHAVIGKYIKILAETRDKLAASVAKFQSLGKKDPYYPVLCATPFLEMFSEVVVTQLLLEQAVIAAAKLDAILAEKGAAGDDDKKKAVLADSSEAAFYHNKICTAGFYASQILPGVFAKHYSFETGDKSALEVVL